MTGKKKIIYYFDREVGDQYYGEGHPMKPFRVRLTHELVVEYGLYKKLNIFKPYALSAKKMMKFHRKDYIEFLRDVTVENQEEYEIESSKFLGKITDDTDCPIFDGLFRFSQLASGASVGAAEHLIASNAEIAINWAGGLHHAKKVQAQGFCYINDIVLAILKLLVRFERVLYVDIDVHHGDGVEEAFYTTDRVMTLSFHQGGNFYPGTGKLEDIGSGAGKNFAVNFPLHEGTDDMTFSSVFKPTFDRVVDVFRPSVIVLQCGADSLTRDRLGGFNLTTRGHGSCVRSVLDKNLPTLILGGGGYTVKNVARCWAYETSICADTPISDDIPYNSCFEKFGPDFRLHIAAEKMENFNTAAYLEATREKIFEHLRGVSIAPSVQIGDRKNHAFHTRADSVESEVEDEIEDDNYDDEDKRSRRTNRTNGRNRIHGPAFSGLVFSEEHEGEFMEDEHGMGFLDAARQHKRKKPSDAAVDE